MAGVVSDFCFRLTVVNAQGEYNIPLEDNENGGNGGAPFGPAPPGRPVPYQTPLP